jgi:hypothetical protein
MCSSDLRLEVISSRSIYAYVCYTPFIFYLKGVFAVIIDKLIYSRLKVNYKVNYIISLRAPVPSSWVVRCPPPPQEWTCTVLKFQNNWG